MAAWAAFAGQRRLPALCDISLQYNDLSAFGGKAKQTLACGSPMRIYEFTALVKIFARLGLWHSNPE